MKGLRVGRVVNYVNESGGVFAAVVAHVIDKEQGIVNLHVFLHYYDEDMRGSYGRANVKYSESREQRTWHWLEED